MSKLSFLTLETLESMRILYFDVKYEMVVQLSLSLDEFTKGGSIGLAAIIKLAEKIGCEKVEDGSHEYFKLDLDSSTVYAQGRLRTTSLNDALELDRFF